MILDLVTKLYERNMEVAKKIIDDVISTYSDVTVIFPIYGVIWKPDSGRMICNTYILINSNLLSYEN